jgi:hypothetical protein
VTLQIYVVTTPVLEEAGLPPVQEVTPPVPLTLQVSAPVGATEPDVPVTVAVNVNAELMAPVPAPVNPIVGEVFAIFTVTGVVAGSPV